MPPIRWDDDDDDDVDDVDLLPLEVHDGENWIAWFSSIAVAALVTGYKASDILTRLRGELERERLVRGMPLNWRWRWRPRKAAASSALKFGKQSSSNSRGAVSEKLYERSTGKTMARFRTRADANSVAGSFTHISRKLGNNCVYMWDWTQPETTAAGAANGNHLNPPTLKPKINPIRPIINFAP